MPGTSSSPHKVDPQGTLSRRHCAHLLAEQQATRPPAHPGLRGRCLEGLSPDHRRVSRPPG